MNTVEILCCRCREIKPAAEFATNHKECKKCQEFYRVRSVLRRKLRELGKVRYEMEVVAKLANRLALSMQVLAEGRYHEEKRGRKKTKAVATT